MLDETNHAKFGDQIQIFPGITEFKGHFTVEIAEEAAKDLSLKFPKAKVIILESVFTIEPRKIEFVRKNYNSNGELVG